MGYTVEETANDDFTTTKTGDTGTISATAATAAFTNTRKSGADLTVTKTVESDLAADANVEFEFTVTLSDTSINQTYGEGDAAVTFANGKTTFKLKHNESKTISGLPLGVGYTVEETANDDFTTTKTGDTGTISATAATAAFTNTRKSGADLTVTKTVESDLAADANVEFEFTVTLSDTSINQTYGEGDAAVTFANGKTTFKLKGGESKTISGLPVGVSYTVVETAVDGMTTTKTGDTGTISATAAEAKFTNTRDTSDLTVTKTVTVPTGFTIDADKEFTFTITVTSGTTALDLTKYNNTVTAGDDGAYTFKLKNGGSITFKDLPYGVTYTVSETAEAGYTTNTPNNATGTTGDTAVTVAFENSYSVKPTTASFPVQKNMVVPEGLTGPADWSYTITVKAITEGAPEAKSMTGTVTKSSNTVTFEGFSFTKPGTYAYQVTESGTVAGVTNDSAATSGKIVTITVVDNKDGTLTATPDFTAASPLTFTNTYKASEVTASFPVTKVMSVPAGLTGPKTWSYTIGVTDNSTTSGTPIEYTVDQDTTMVNVGPFTYTKPGTYTYTVSESGTIPGVTNDANASGKTATIVIEDDGNGKLTVKSATGVTFTNVYDTEDVIIYPAEIDFALKNVTATTEDGKGHTFSFALAAVTAGAPMPANAAASVSYTAGEKGEKPIPFGEITYNAPGTYTYTVTEADPGAGWTVGNNGATVTVKVTDNGDGTLNAEVTASATITNSYSSKGTLDTSTTAILNKTVTADGTAWAPQTFEFTIEAKDGAPLGKDAEGKEVTSGTATFNEAGTQTIDFGKITYTKAGTYTYTVTETSEAPAGWTYDNEAKTVEVDVKDNGDGTLTASVTTAATITNVYAADGTVVLQAKKVLTGRDWLEGESFTFTLKDADGNTIEEKTVTKGNETVTFKAIEYTAADAGKTFKYTISETSTLPFHVTKSDDISVAVQVKDNGDGTLTATATYTPDDQTITNTYTVEKKTVTVMKIWDDASNQDGKRPASVKFTVTGDDGNTYPVTLTAPEEGTSDIWTAEVEVIRYKPDLNEVEVKFTVSEDSVSNGYTATNVDQTKLAITNSYTTATTSVSGKKTWDDANDQDGIRPDSITVRLLANGKEVASKAVTAADGWAYTFTGLPKFAGGEVITYTVTEDAVKNYSATIDGFNITNTYKPGVQSLTVTKQWDDENNQDGIRPDSIVVKLMLDGKECESVTLNAGNKWTYTWPELPAKEAGEKLVYSVDEDVSTGYSKLISGDSEKGYTIINTHVPEVLAPFTVTKVWDDNNNQDGSRPSNITVTLLADGEAVETATLSEANGWTYEFKNLPKYAKGQLITYTIEEAAVTDYSSDITGNVNSGFTVTNSKETDKTSITVSKTWNDSNDKDGLRPDSIEVVLYADGKSVETATLTAAGGWKYTFKDLDKYANGKLITYTVGEPSVPSGYTSQVSGYTITNTHTVTPPSPPPVTTIRIEIVKVWEDDSNASGTRTETVEVTLLKGGVANLTRDLGDSNEWKYEGYVEAGYDYKVVETPVEGYESIVTQSPIPGGIRFTVTNKLTKTPDLNTKDHVAYIVGYPDGTVRPDQQITRAEVATIFFRLLTEEARDKYWSQTNPYPDVQIDDWFNNAISTLTKMGIINGYEDGTFRPNNPITRAELTKMAVSFFSSADQYFGKTPSFSDVPANAWYTRFIAAAEELGLINGYPDGTFRPNNYITRAETCTIVNRTLGRGPHKYHLLPYQEMINWPDNSVDAWYYAQIQEATNSHDYDWINEPAENTTVEQWTAKLEERDWVALEQVWSTSHSAPGGEVMG